MIKKNGCQKNHNSNLTSVTNLLGGKPLPLTLTISRLVDRSSHPFLNRIMLVHALIISTTHYCSTLYMGLPLQVYGQNAITRAIRLIMDALKFDHISPILAHFHWLTVCFLAKFKVLMLTYTVLYSLDLSMPAGMPLPQVNIPSHPLFPVSDAAGSLSKGGPEVIN